MTKKQFLSMRPFKMSNSDKTFVFLPRIGIDGVEGNVSNAQCGHIQAVVTKTTRKGFIWEWDVLNQRIVGETLFSSCEVIK